MKKRLSLVLLVALLLFTFISPTSAGTAVVVGGFGPGHFDAGFWLDARFAEIDIPDPSQPGYYWLKFRAQASFSSVYVVIYSNAATVSAGTWNLYLFDTDNDTTLAGTPYVQGAINIQGDQHLIFDFGTVPAGQYIFKIELDYGQPTDRYMNVAVSTSTDPLDEDKFEYDFNAFSVGPSEHIYAQFTYDGDGEFFGDLTEDGLPPAVPEDNLNMTYGGSQIRSEFNGLEKQGIRFVYNNVPEVDDVFESYDVNYTVLETGAMMAAASKFGEGDVYEDLMKLDEVGNSLRNFILQLDSLATYVDDAEVEYYASYVYNVPEDGIDDVIVSRLYVKATDGVNVKYFYSDVATRTVRDVYDSGASADVTDPEVHTWFQG